MSKKMNKTQAIKEALAKNPEIGPKELAEQLNKAGVKVTAQYVSMIKSKLKQGHSKRKAAIKRAGRNGDVLTDLQQAKQFADRFGGVNKALEALELLKSVQTET